MVQGQDVKTSVIWKEIALQEAAISKCRNNDSSQFALIINLARLYRLKSDYERSLDLLKSNANAIKTKMGALNSLYVDCLCETGLVYYSLSDVEEASRYWQTADSLVNLIPWAKKSEITLLIDRCRYYNYFNQPDRSLPLIEKALAILRKEPHLLCDREKAGLYCEYGYSLKLLYRKNDDYAKASAISRRCLDTALVFAKRSQDVSSITSVLVAFGNTHADETFTGVNTGKHAEKAFDYYSEALNLRMRYFGSEGESVAMTHYLIGLLNQYGRNDLFKSIENYNSAIHCLLHDKPVSDCLRPPEVNDGLANTALMLELLNFKGEALFRAYRKYEETKYLVSARDHFSVAIRYWTALLKKYKTYEIYKVLGTYNHLPFRQIIRASLELYKLTGNEALKDSILRYSELSKYSVLVRDRYMINQGIDVQVSFPVVSAEKVQEHLRRESAIIEYFTEEDLVMAILMTKQRIEISFSIRADMDKIVSSFLESVETFDEKKFADLSRKLYGILMEPFENSIDSSICNLIIIPHGPISRLPFDALLYGDQVSGKSSDFLIKRFRISYEPSLALMYDKNEAVDVESKGEILAVAPSFRKLSVLPYSGKLVRSLSRNYKGEYLMGSDATRASFLRNLKSYKILHFSTHSLVKPLNPEESMIFLTDENDSSGNYLTRRDILEFRHPFDLVILNTCESGSGKFERGEGTISFARDFICSGSSSIISALWKIDDRASNEILTMFYENLDRGMSCSEALRQSKLTFMNDSRFHENSSPFYWSGLVLTGSDQTISLSHNYRDELLVTLLFILVILMGLLFYRKFVIRRVSTSN